MRIFKIDKIKIKMIRYILLKRIVICVKYLHTAYTQKILKSLLRKLRVAEHEGLSITTCNHIRI